jgi:hypothetical protein
MHHVFGRVNWMFGIEVWGGNVEYAQSKLVEIGSYRVSALLGF